LYKKTHQEEFVNLGQKVLSRIAIIAGNGILPKLVYFECKKQRKEPLLIGLKGIDENIYLNGIVSKKFHYGKVGKILEYIKINDCRDIILVGAFKRPTLKSISGIDLKGAALISKIIKSKGDNNSLEILIDFLKKENLNVLGVKDILPSLFVKKGLLTDSKVSKQQNDGILIGRDLIDSISKYDIGQSVIISANRVLGVEGPEGTDSLIKRCSQMSYEEKPILVKIPKLQQDIRVDSPTIGLNTIELLISSGFSGLAIKSELTIILEKNKVISLANKNNLFIVSI